MSNQKRAIHKARMEMGNRYAFWDGDEGFDAVVLPPRLVLSEINPRQAEGVTYSENQIREIVKNLQVSLWRNRDKFGLDCANDPLKVLEPSKVFELLDYQNIEQGSLGSMATKGRLTEVAAVINPRRKTVYFSKTVRSDAKRFTEGHELGHAVLHSHLSEAHRDRVPDHSLRRGRIEHEADRFSTHFLMPEKLFLEKFRVRFGHQPFCFNDDSCSLLGSAAVALKFDSRNVSIGDVAQILASARHYGTKHFQSIAEEFGVSNKAMSIRIEELIDIRIKK